MISHYKVYIPNNPSVHIYILFLENIGHISKSVISHHLENIRIHQVLRTVNHLFLWAMAYHGYVSHNQRVLLSQNPGGTSVPSGFSNIRAAACLM